MNQSRSINPDQTILINQSRSIQINQLIISINHTNRSIRLTGPDQSNRSTIQPDNQSANQSINHLDQSIN